MDANSRFTLYQKVFAELGTAIGSNAVVLDFGCGDGSLVKAGRERGLNVIGCDIDFDHKWVNHAVLGPLVEQRIVWPIQTSPYRLPFEDNSIDFVVSDQVMEHVMDYESTLAELKRVMRPGAVFLHSFPSRYSPIEPHIFVPLATVFRSPWWLSLWAGAGIRNQYQKGMGVADVSKMNKEFLASSTNYLPPAELRRNFSRHFQQVRFAEEQFLKYSNRARFLYQWSRILPFIPSMYGLLHARLVYGRK